jgi:hypothetical protein
MGQGCRLLVGIERRHEMTESIGFVAYSAEPAEIGHSIDAGVRAHNQRFGPDNLRSWRENDIAGRFLSEPILDHIRESKCLIADVSISNFNVAYEIGYAIGIGRRVFLIKSRSVLGDEDEIRHVGIFDTLGYQLYDNARDLEAYFATLRGFSPIVRPRSPDAANPL